MLQKQNSKAKVFQFKYVCSRASDKNLISTQDKVSAPLLILGNIQ